ncbi:MAG: pyridoxine 5'-phosphate synthase, partial [Elusimicrobiota bacterium]
MNKRLKLGVNIDHIATLREARKEGIPDIVKAARAVKRGGAEGITMHLRLDRRHIRDDDVYVIKKENLLPINLEMAPVDEIKEIALEVKPKSVCIVPEKRQELTTEGGLNISTDKKNIRDIIYALKQAGIEISLFIEPSIKFIKEAAEVG